MKVRIRSFTLMIVTLFFCSTKQKSDTCGILERVKYSSRKHFSPEVKWGLEINSSVQLSQKDYKELFKIDKIETDTCFLFGKFNINKNRIGVYALRSTYECDNRLTLIELHLFDNCQIVGSKTIMIEDNHVLTYNVSSKFNKDFSQLTITEKVGSEYSEHDSIIDTLFTNTYRIDLRSKNLDTIYRNRKFELLKSPLQN